MVRKSMFAASLLVTVALFAVSAAAQSGAKPQTGGGVTTPVQVVNTPNVNVANTPSVTVANTPNVNVTNTPSVTVANAPNVSVTNTPSVDIANTPTVNFASGATMAVTSPLDPSGNPMPLATLEAVQVYGSHCMFYFNGSYTGFCDFTAVPQGKQLVVQEFDAAGGVETGNRPAGVLLFNTTTGANYFTYTFMVNSGGLDYLATHQETRVYVAQGNTPYCAVELAGNSEGSYECDISGFLVDVSGLLPGTTVQHPKPPLSQLIRKLPGR